MPASAPSVRGVATCRVVRSMLATISGADIWVWPMATAAATTAAIAPRILANRHAVTASPLRRLWSSAPAAGEQQRRGRRPQMVEPAHEYVGGHEQEDQALDHGHQVDRHAGLELHAGRPVAQAAEKQRRGYHS